MIQQTNFIQQPHIFNSVTNSVVLSNFSFISHSIILHIQPCDKFNYFISFYILIYFKSVQIYLFYLIPQSNFIQSPTYSKVQHSQWSYLVLHSHILQQSHLFNSVTNSVVLSNFSFMSHSIVPHIQPCNKFNCFISFYILIYFKSVQIYYFYLIPQSNLIQSPTYSKVQQSQLSYLVLHSHLFQQSHLFNSVTNSVVLSTFTFISHSTIPTYSTM